MDDPSWASAGLLLIYRTGFAPDRTTPPTFVAQVNVEEVPDAIGEAGEVDSDVTVVIIGAATFTVSVAQSELIP